MTKLNIDCLTLIFNETSEKGTLYSCLLVNKEWCNIVVPILWKKFSWRWDGRSKETYFFNTILSCLPSSSKQLLSDNGAKLPSEILLRSPLFDYISFCEFPTDKIVKVMVEFDTVKPESYNLFEQEIYKLFVSQCNNIKTLQWETSQPLPLFPGASTCFSQLNRLYVDIDFVGSNALYEMAQICKDLNE